jgi:hypothetical protein
MKTYSLYCEVCGTLITGNDYHQHHRDECKGDGCDCDMVTHPECCPTCKEDKAKVMSL